MQAQSLLLHIITLNDTHTHTHTHTHTVEFLWTRDRPVTEASTSQQTTVTRDKHPRPRRYSNPQSNKTEAAAPPLSPRGHRERQRGIGKTKFTNKEDPRERNSAELCFAFEEVTPWRLVYTFRRPRRSCFLHNDGSLQRCWREQETLKVR